jgi:hypothetical protein
LKCDAAQIHKATPYLIGVPYRGDDDQHFAKRVFGVSLGRVTKQERSLAALRWTYDE